MPPIKELHFFDHLYIERFRKWTGRHIEQKVATAIRNHIHADAALDYRLLNYLSGIMARELFTEEWYEALFSVVEAQGKLLGEVTPTYSTIPDDGIAYVRELLREPKIIYIIRHPVTRALSQIRMNIRKQRGSSTADNCYEVTPKEWGDHVSNWDVQQRGRYSRYIPAWRQVFPENKMMFVPYQRISKEPLNVLSEIEEFLNLSPCGKYEKASRRIHAGNRLSIPESVISAVHDNVKDEVAFLRSYFGEDFLTLT